MPDLPTITFGEHSLALAPSAIYPVPSGYIVRKLWSADDFSIDRPYATIAAAGYLVSSETALGIGHVRRVDSGICESAGSDRGVPPLSPLLKRNLETC